MNKSLKIILIFLILYYLFKNKKSKKKLKYKKIPSNLKNSMDIFQNLWNNTKKFVNKNILQNPLPKKIFTQIYYQKQIF